MVTAMASSSGGSAKEEKSRDADGQVANARVLPSESAAAMHLSHAQETAIRLLPGNDRCVDCNAICPQWASVSFGVLLCLSCAGVHRSMGVSASFVKSLAMDSWIIAERRALEVGGNAKWIAVCTGASISHLSVKDKYASPVAKAYKSRLVQVAQGAEDSSSEHTATGFLNILRGDSTDDPVSVNSVEAQVDRVSPFATEDIDAEDESTRRRSSSATKSSVGLLVRCTTCSASVEMDLLDDHSRLCVVKSPSCNKWETYGCSIGSPNASLGLSLSKTKGGFAEVTKVTPGGSAENASVKVGSFIVAVNHKKKTQYDDIVPLIQSLPRPLHLQFALRSPSSTTAVAPIHASVPEPRAVETVVVLETLEHGCSFASSPAGCIVTEVQADSEAAQKAILVGSRVIAVDGQSHLDGDAFAELLSRSHRPLTLKLLRVEGLIRHWKN